MKADLMTEKIIELIGEIRPYEHINPTTELIKSGILDSLAIIGLVVSLEDEFGVEIADEAVTRENFSTVAAISSLINKV